MAYEVCVAVAKAETRFGEVKQLADQRRGMMNHGQDEAGNVSWYQYDLHTYGSACWQNSR
jgi:hypothetical protein